MVSRVEGQIWIDRESPYRLKYYVNGEEFEVSVAQNYKGKDGICKGNVVALDGDTLYKAVFPEDIDRVIGIAGQTFNGTEGLSERKYLPILRMDKLELNEEEIYNCFASCDIHELVKIIKNQSSLSLIGAPVYWFIGETRYLSEGDEPGYIYFDSTGYTGRLTLFTPSGFQWNQPVISDESLNVSYNNLPIVGTIADYSLDLSTERFTKMIINVNYSGFDSSLEWNWPYLKGDDVGKKIPVKADPSDLNGSVNITVRHGLFPYNETSIGDRKIQIVPRCFCDIVALNTNNDTENRVSAAVDNYYGQQEGESASGDRRTEIYMKTTETLRYSISGRVNYKFNKTIIG